MIFIVGDIHGDYDAFWHSVNRKIKETGKTPSAIIQVGDFGFYSPKYPTEWDNKLNIPIYFIEGNHEDFPYLKSKMPNGIDMECKNLHYLLRGTVMNFEGKTFAFCGGADSVDRYWRKDGISWWQDEQVREWDIDDVIEKIADQKIDYLITHAPPVSVIKIHWPKLNKEYWGLPDNWEDVSSIQIQRLWDHLGNPMIISGHMHKPISGPNYRILNIDEVMVVE